MVVGEVNLFLKKKEGKMSEICLTKNHFLDLFSSSKFHSKKVFCFVLFFCFSY